MMVTENDRINIDNDCWVFPAPVVIVSCGDAEGISDITTCAWSGNVNSDPAMAYVSVRPERYAHELIEKTGEFVLNITDKDMVKEADICGMYSGRNSDKWALSGLTPMKAAKVGAPIIAESPVSIECKVKQVVHLGSHDMFIGEVLSVDENEKFVDEYGKLRLKDAGVLSLVRHSYIPAGEEINRMGFVVRRRSGKAVIKKPTK